MPKEKLMPLAKEETAIARLMAQGFSDDQIAKIRHRHPRTVKNQMIIIRQKLGFVNVDRNVRVLVARWVWENDSDFK